MIPGSALFAQVPSQQGISGQEQTRKMQEEEDALRKKIEKEREKPVIEEKEIPPPTPSLAEEKTPIKRIQVTGVTLISEKEINKVTAQFENKELTFADMKKAANMITDIFRQKGYITSRAYVPPQKIKDGLLQIKALEGLMGDLEVKGNRYFKTSIIKKKISLIKGAIFNYNTLRKNLTRINQHPDRAAKAILKPGKEPGTTDVILEVKDRLPIHAGFNYDNFGSRYISKDRYSMQVTHNNLFGLDDSLTFQYQLAQHSRYFLKNLRYLLPLAGDWQFGLSAAFSRVKLGEDYEDSDVRGKSKLYGIFANKPLIDLENFSLGLNLGFDYKDITNYQQQVVSSRDSLRVAKLGFDIDLSDNLGGRNLISHEVNVGMADIMGGLKQHDSKASRNGAGGKFTKNIINLFRLQKMPFSSNLLFKNQIQLSSYILPASEQFQIGGIANVRGYPPAEAVGDKGYAWTLEWSFPLYPVPKVIKVPFSSAKLYDALKVAIFYDWANARLRRPSATEEKSKTLRAVGYGFRFNLPEDFSLRLDFGWPLDNTPADSDHMHTWFQVSKTF